MKGKVDFIIANPPASSGETDGLDFRRRILKEGPEFLKDEGILLFHQNYQTLDRRNIEFLLY